MARSTGLSIIVLLSSAFWCDCSKPNIVIFVADDMGFADVQAFGNPLSYTPNLDALLRDGLKFTQFYSASPICSPSRAGLLTGRYPVRTGVWNNEDHSAVFHQETTEGLPHTEVTIPEMLARQGYKSSLIGKWHLGVGYNREYLPLHHGFDNYFGIPHTHADCPCEKCFFPDDNCTSQDGCNYSHAPCQLMLGDEIIEQPVDLIKLAERQARAARSWIREYACTRTPFFLMYAFLHTHIPNFAGKRFRNTTLGGEYTDSLAELDWQVGEVMDELKKSGVINNTLVIVTSDNGAALGAVTKGGFSGVLRCGKGSTFEGGVRAPTVAFWQGRISSGISTEFLSQLDIWPTLRSLSGSSPDDFNVILDGFDFSDVLFRNEKSTRSSMLYYHTKPDPRFGPYAVRNERYKAHFIVDCEEACERSTSQSDCTSTFHDPPLLYDLLLDPEERLDLSKFEEFQQIVQDMTNLRLQESRKVQFAKSVLKATDEDVQLCCDPGCQPFPSCCQCASNYTEEMFPLNRACHLEC
ncbi:arylsulfatase A-like [Anneissia japonica]|uniref:arylsulfatase A-like n=1 Tax=Anneissia japonica TaxID=1529436 RepID=UPI00142594C5|nr:arylsulfatase A-like [Anneissia japonica]